MSLKDDILRGVFRHCPIGYVPVRLAADAVGAYLDNPIAREFEGEARLREVERGEFYLDDWGDDDGEAAAYEEYVHVRTIRAAALSAGNLKVAADMAEVLALLPADAPTAPPGLRFAPDFHPFTLGPLPAGLVAPSPPPVPAVPPVPPVVPSASTSPPPVPAVPSASPAPLPDTPAARAVSAPAQHGEAVLDALRSLGVDPMAVAAPRGKKGDKARARAVLGGKMTDSQFRKAWEYLLGEKKIRNVEPSPGDPPQK